MTEKSKTTETWEAHIKEVTVAPYDFEVCWDHETCVALGATGSCMEDTGKIYIDPDNAVDVVLESLLHEVMHAVWGQTYLDKEFPDGEPDSDGEKMIRTLSPRIYAFLKDNPHYMKAILALGGGEE